MRRLLIFGLLVISVSILLGAIAVWGEDQSKNSIDRLIQKTKQDILAKKKKEKSVLGNLVKQQQELSHLEQNYGQIKAELRFAKNKLNITQRELQNLETNLDRLHHDQHAQEQLLNQRLVVVYKHGFQSYLEVLFNAGDYSEFVNRVEAVSFFIKSDLRLLEEIQTTKSMVESKQTMVVSKKKEYEQQYKKMTTLEEQVSLEQRKVSSKVIETKKELNRIQRDRAQLEKALEEYEETSREIEAAIQMREQKGLELGTGKMIWPVAKRGRISSTFGWRLHPVLRKKKYHNGQDIAVPSGTPVLAADSGVVLVSGWKGGYGYFVAIDHGGGISTCYGHNSRLLVKVGEKVIKGQTIALSGSTGLSTGPHLHFEVRKNGVPIDPLPFLP